MSSILDALKRRPRSTAPHRAFSDGTGQADVVLETLGSRRERTLRSRVAQLGLFVLCAVAALLLLLAGGC
jgi:hypothetical protein